MKSEQKYTQHSLRSSSQLPGTRSVAESLLESLSDTLSQTGLRPDLTEPATGGRARFRRIAGTMAMILGLAALSFVVLRSGSDLPVTGDPVATLEIVRGSVGVLPASAQAGSSLLTLAAGQPIHAGTVIETASAGAAGGRAAVRLAGGQSMRLDAETRVRLDSSSRLVLERGALYVDSAARGSVEVRTALGMVRDIGTQFEVRLLAGPDGEEPSLRVRVRQGSVVLERDGETHHAGLGEELRVDRDGALARATVPVHGPQWDWVLDTAPAPDIADQPLAAFLDWVSREGGWDVRYADDETARLASTTILHGDVRDLTLTEASSMVLGSSGMSYRVVDGTFLVEPKGEEIARR